MKIIVSRCEKDLSIIKEKFKNIYNINLSDHLKVSFFIYSKYFKIFFNILFFKEKCEWKLSNNIIKFDWW
jgi:hypothetical protein